MFVHLYYILFMPLLTSYIELIDYFKNEEICLSYLEYIRWNGKPKCPFCNSEKVYRTNRGFKCAKRYCYKKFTAKVRTIYENSKIPLRKWFLAEYALGSNPKGVNSVQLGKMIGVHQHSAWFMAHRIREAYKDDTQHTFKGVVEIDEMYVGGKNKNRHANKRVENSQGRSTKDKTAVVGILNRGGKVRTFVVEEANQETLHNLVKANVEKGSTLITDAYVPYRGLNQWYTHVSVKHGEGENKYVTDNFHHTNSIEGYWSVFKRGIIGTYHYMSRKHLHRYCKEYDYRYNERKETDGMKFEDMVRRAEGKRLRYADLIRKTDPELPNEPENPLMDAA